MSFIALNKEGKVILYKNREWMTEEEALQFKFCNDKEKCYAIRQNWEQEISKI